MSYETLYGIAFVIYIIVTVILWRNIVMPLAFKAMFCLFVVPIFFLGMWLNLWFFEMFYPAMFEIHNNEPSGRHSGKGLIAVILAFPIALVMSYAWYWIMRSFDLTED